MSGCRQRTGGAGCRCGSGRSGQDVGVAVEFSADGIRRVLPDGRCEEVSWIDLAEVRVITNADGPSAEDVFFVLTAAGGVRGVAVPHSMATDAFIRWLQSLPGFDNQALIQAMLSVVEEQFLLWRAAPDER
jgi:hypothetical protein